MTPEEIEARRAAVDARRQARKDAAEAGRAAREVVDLEALADIEDEHDGELAVLALPFLSDDLPVRVAARRPKPAEMARYRAKVRPAKDGSPGDPIAAAEQLAAVTRVYPPRTEEGDAQYRKVCETFTGAHCQLGTMAGGLALGKEADEGKG